MKTSYVLGSIDRLDCWIKLDRKTDGGQWEFAVVIDHEDATHFDFMSAAQLELFTLNADSPLSVSLNLIVIPVQVGMELPIQTELPLGAELYF